MAVLTTKARKALPKSAFAGPDESYPVEDKAHARAALSRVSHAEKVGHVSSSTAAKIRSKAKRVLAGTNLVQNPRKR